MKKIILAVASVLALGMLVSCKQEVSGNLTVTNLNKSLDSNQSETYYYKAEGGSSYSTTTVYSSKTATGSDTVNSKVVVDYTYTISGDNNLAKLAVSTPANDNKVTYTFTIPGMTKSTKTVTTATVGNATTTVTDYATTNESATTIELEKIGGKYYFTATDGSKVAIDNFNPLADTVDLSVLSDVAKKVTAYQGYNKDSSGNEYYTQKTVTTTGAKSYTIKLSKI